MEDKLLDLRIEELLLIESEVTKRQVKHYMRLFDKEILIEPICVTYCFHLGKYIVRNGNTRTVAAYYFGKSSILSKVGTCKKYEGCILDFEPEFFSVRNVNIFKKRSYGDS